MRPCISVELPVGAPKIDLHVGSYCYVNGGIFYKSVNCSLGGAIFLSYLFGYARRDLT